MFTLKLKGTVIAEGLKIVGSVTAEGLVEVNGQIEGEVHCTSLVISNKAHISGTVEAERVVVNGKVEGPIHGGDVVLKSQAWVVGDIFHRSLTIENGAHFDGRSLKAPATNAQQLQTHSDENGTRPRREATNKVREAISAARAS
jgi:cytoskeletal protein CcmA (bactofilin family)